MVPLVSSYRYEGPEVDSRLAKSEAQILHKKIKDEEYNHEEVVRILTTRSKAQLLATFNAYHEEHGNPINKVKFSLFFLNFFIEHLRKKDLFPPLIHEHLLVLPALLNFLTPLALNSKGLKDRPRMLSRFVFVLKIGIKRAFTLPFQILSI